MINNRIKIILGDITKIKVDAVVNAANRMLMGGGGVDGAIHKAAGPRLLDECKTLGGCKTGEAKITKGYNQPAKYVIHTVGPVWSQKVGFENNAVGTLKEDKLLASCYKNSLELALSYGIKTIAFPAISTGAYGFPKERAVEIAFRTVIEFLKNDKIIEKLVFVCYSEDQMEIYNNFSTSLEK